MSVCAVACFCPLRAASIGEAEALNPPAPARIAEVHAAAQREGWSAQAAGLRTAAFLAYEREKLPAAEAWLNLARWAGLLGTTEAEFVPRWMEAVQTARVAYPGMDTRYELRPQPLAARMSPALQAWLLGDQAFAAEFFGTLAPVDYLPRALSILDELHRQDPTRFKTYAHLALAIALVYDLPPPPFWPHAQVSPSALPRRWPEPAAAFQWWIKQEQRGRLDQKLTRLGAAELKFVVDATAPFPELEWAQTLPDLPLSQLARAYAMIRYRNDRVTGGRFDWPGTTYTLKEILAAGGICPDQAYFATQVGKARGVPTLLIYGAGNDGRHAWFGYLDGGQKWHLDAGRYAEQKFVTGFARDPQTWREFSDHELQFLSEGFHALPSFKSSRTHEQFAAEYLLAGRASAAAQAARKAVNFERRNQAGWELLLQAAKKEGKDVRTQENVLREAALAFQRYPDLEAEYVNRVAESLRRRGETSAADAESRRVALKNKSTRGDLANQQARDAVARAIKSQPLPEQIRVYNSVVDQYGSGAGVGFFDDVVAGFVLHLMELKQKAEAQRALDRARRVQNVQPGTQLAAEFDRLEATVRQLK